MHTNEFTNVMLYICTLAGMVYIAGYTAYISSTHLYNPTVVHYYLFFTNILSIQILMRNMSIPI